MDQNAPSVQPTAQSPSGTASKDKRMYPELIIQNNANPNKLYAFPFLGLALKILMIIPVGIVLILVEIVFSVLLLVTPFVILFTGKYWDTGYKFTIGYFTYRAKIMLFLSGLTDKYPGFNLEPNGLFEMHLAKPESPSRWRAFPIFAYMARAIIMIPYSLYTGVLQYGVYAAVVASWFGVWIKGKYPESLYEFNKDTLRVSLAYDAYMAYLSDTYPSFRISMNHKKVKIILLIIGILFTVINISSQINNVIHPKQNATTYNNTNYNNSAPDSGGSAN